MKKSLFLLSILFCFLTNAQDLTNKWELETNIEGFGTIRMILDFTKTTDTTFKAASRPQALKEIVGGLKYMVAKKKDQYKNGAFAHISNGKIKGDHLEGVMTTPIRNFYFDAQLKDNELIGTLSVDEEGSSKYKFTAQPISRDAIDYDYVALIHAIKKTFQENIYDRALLETREWKKFFKELNKTAPEIRDDLEMIIYFSFLAGKIEMSHISILKHNPWDDLEETVAEPMVSFKVIDDKVAYIKFDAFQLADSLLVRSYFKTIINQKNPNLIFDFRGCTGGDYSSMYLAQYLTNKTYEAGFFIGNQYYKENQELPDEATLKALPSYAGKSLREFLQVIKEKGLLRGTVVPDKELHYSGKVYALIDNNSASATEPISYFLKQHNLATLVGERTAGAMLSSTVITVKDDWSLMLPVADYYTSDRFRIEQNGVAPNIEINPKEALKYVLKNIEP